MTLQVLQITDTHIYADKNKLMKHVKTYHSLKQVLQATQSIDANALFVTGDLSQDETEQSYQNIAALCKIRGLPTYTIPGNHDNLANLNAYFQSGVLQKQKVWREQNWQIILLNSQVVGQVHGILTEEELTFLQTTLDAYPYHHTMVTLHHQPIAMGSQWIDEFGLKNSPNLLNIIKKSPQVKAVFWGHVHQPLDTIIDDIYFAATPSTSTQFSIGTITSEIAQALPGYRYFILYPDGSFKTQIIRVHPFIKAIVLKEPHSVLEKVLQQLNIPIKTLDTSYQLILTDNTDDITENVFMVNIQELPDVSAWQNWLADKAIIMMQVKGDLSDKNLETYLMHLLTATPKGVSPYIKPDEE